MKTKNAEINEIRKKVLSNPKIILEDIEIMKALVDTHESGIGSNVIDLRSVVMSQLEAKIQKTEATNKSIVAAAYENITGYELIHKAVLTILEAQNFTELELQFSRNIQSILKIAHIHIMIEQNDTEYKILKESPYISIVKPKEVVKYLNTTNNDYEKDIIMRGTVNPNKKIYGEKANNIKSEALINLNLGKKTSGALLIMGSTNVSQFEPRQRTELLSFLGAVLERVIRGWSI